MDIAVDVQCLCYAFVPPFTPVADSPKPCNACGQPRDQHVDANCFAGYFVVADSPKGDEADALMDAVETFVATEMACYEDGAKEVSAGFTAKMKQTLRDALDRARAAGRREGLREAASLLEERADNFSSQAQYGTGCMFNDEDRTRAARKHNEWREAWRQVAALDERKGP